MSAFESLMRRADTLRNVEHLESQVRDKHMGFKGFRICHHTHNKSQVCCAGFWARHKDKFAVGQIAQRLNMVEFVDIDIRAPTKTEKEPKTMSTEQRDEQIREAITALRNARMILMKAGAMKAANTTMRAIKSADGALRHRLREQIASTNEEPAAPSAQ